MLNEMLSRYTMQTHRECWRAVTKKHLLYQRFVVIQCKMAKAKTERINSIEWYKVVVTE